MGGRDKQVYPVHPFFPLPRRGWGARPPRGRRAGSRRSAAGPEMPLHRGVQERNSSEAESLPSASRPAAAHAGSVRVKPWSGRMMENHWKTNANRNGDGPEHDDSTAAPLRTERRETNAAEGHLTRNPSVAEPAPLPPDAGRARRRRHELRPGAGIQWGGWNTSGNIENKDL